MSQEVPYTERKFLDRDATPNPSFFAQWFEITDPNEVIRECQYYRTRGVPLDEDFFETEEQLDNYLFYGIKPLAELEDSSDSDKQTFSLSLDLSSLDDEDNSDDEDEFYSSSDSGSSLRSENVDEYLSVDESQCFHSWNDDEEEVDFSELPLPNLDELEEEPSTHTPVVDNPTFNHNVQNHMYTFGSSAPFMYTMGNYMVQPGYNLGFYNNQYADTVPPQSHSLFQDVLEHEEYSDSSEKSNHAPSVRIQSESQEIEKQFNQMSLYNNSPLYHTPLASNTNITQNGNVGNSAPLMMGYYYPVYMQTVPMLPTMGNSLSMGCFNQPQPLPLNQNGATISSGKTALPCQRTPGLATMAQWAA